MCCKISHVSQIFKRIIHLKTQPKNGDEPIGESTSTDEIATLSQLKIYVGEYDKNGRYIQTDHFIKLDISGYSAHELKHKNLIKGFGAVIAFYVMTMKSPFFSDNETLSFNGLKTIKKIKISGTCTHINESLPEKEKALSLHISHINNKAISAMVSENNAIEMRSLQDLQACFNNMSTLVDSLSHDLAMTGTEISNFPNTDIHE